jgi:hypothetical protein
MIRKVLNQGSIVLYLRKKGLSPTDTYDNLLATIGHDAMA